MEASNSLMSNTGKDREENRERGGGAERNRSAVQPQIFQGAVLHIKIKWSQCKIIRLVFIGRMPSLIMEWLQGEVGAGEAGRKA